MILDYCTITPDRGDREVLTKNCKERLHAQGHSNWFVDFEANSDKCDIVPRIKHGAFMVKSCGFDWAFIIENDDYYPADYIQNLLPLLDGLDFIGWQNTFYYNIKTLKYSRFEHETHSSLFCTGFRLSALDDFKWPKDDDPFLDIALWEHAKQSGKNWKLLRTDNPCLGIKGHGMGKMGGKGHRIDLQRHDPQMQFLRSRVDKESFEFYRNLHNSVK